MISTKCFNILSFVFILPSAITASDSYYGDPDEDTANGTDVDIYELLKVSNDDLGKEASGFAETEPSDISANVADDGKMTEHPGLKNAEEILNGRSIDPEEDGEDDSSSFIWIFIVVVLLAFVLLGVFNHVIIPMFCMGKTVKKEKVEDGTILKMSKLEKDDKKKEGPKEDMEEEKRGSYNEAFEDISLKTDEKELERVISIENENFERTVLKAVSAISPDMSKALDIDNEEHTNTPRNSLITDQEIEKGELDKKVEPVQNERVDPQQNEIVDPAQNEKVNPLQTNEDESQNPVNTQHKAEASDKSSPVASPKDKSTSTAAKDAKDKFRSRKKSSLSIEIEDGNITKFVEGSPGARISAITESSHE